MISGAANARSIHEPEWLPLMTPMKIQVPTRKYNKAPKNQYIFIPLFLYACSWIDDFCIYACLFFRSHCLIDQGTDFLTLSQFGFLFFLMIKL